MIVIRRCKGKRLRRRFIIGLSITGVVILLGSNGTAVGQVGFVVAPMSLNLTVPSGGTTTSTVSIFSEQERVAKFRVYTCDVKQGGRGYDISEEVGGDKWSCAGWIEMDTSEFILEPKESKDISFKLSVPRGERGGRYAGIVFELVPEKPKAEKPWRTEYRWRTMCLVMLTIGGGRLRKEAIISKFEVRVPSPVEKKRFRIRDEALIFSGSLKNTGNIHVFGKGRLRLRSKEGKRVGEAPLGSGRGAVLPGSFLDFRTIRIGNLPPGEYIAEAIIDYGGYRPATAKTLFSVGSQKLETAKALDLALHPELLEVKVPPGGFRRMNVRLSNREDRQIRIRSYVSDIAYDSKGKLTLLDPGQAKRSCAGWISPHSSEFILRPKEERVLPVEVRVPRNVEGGRYAVLVFEANSAGSKTDASTVQMISPVMLTIAGSVKSQGKIVNFEVINRGKPLKFLAFFKNTGNIHLKVKCTGSIKAKMGEKKGEITFVEKEFIVLPGALREVEGIFEKDLAPGEYIAEVVFFSGEKKIATSEISFNL